jgi:hypothetical protein
MESSNTKIGREGYFSPNNENNNKISTPTGKNYNQNIMNNNTKGNNQYSNNNFRKNSDVVDSKPVFYNSSKTKVEDEVKVIPSNTTNFENNNNLSQFSNEKNIKNDVRENLKNLNINQQSSINNKPVTFVRQGFTNENKQIQPNDINKNYNNNNNNTYSYDNNYNNNTLNYTNFDKSGQKSLNQNHNNSKQVFTWFDRYSKNDFYKNRKIDDDNKEYLDEHLKLLEKKEGNLSKLDIGINLYDYNLEKMNSKFKVNSFNDIGLEKILLENLKSMKFDSLTPIQKTVIPYVVEGEDIMGCAQTGSGKTVAFLLPIIDKMLKRGPPNAVLKVGMLIFKIYLFFNYKNRN